MKTLIAIALGLLLSSSISAQNIENFKYFRYGLDDELFLALGMSFTSISNKAAPNNFQHDLSGWVIHLDMRDYQLEQGKPTMHFTNKLFGDILFFGKKVKENPNNARRAVNSTITTGWLGWWDWNWNITAPNNFQLAAGINLRDYFLLSTYQYGDRPTTKNIRTVEPQGYYFAGGPSAIARFAPTTFLMLSAKFNYSFSAVRAVSLSYAERDDDYPKPHFTSLELEALSGYGFFAALHHNAVINRGDQPNSTKRWDLIFGFRIML